MKFLTFLIPLLAPVFLQSQIGHLSFTSDLLNETTRSNQMLSGHSIGLLARIGEFEGVNKNKRFIYGLGISGDFLKHSGVDVFGLVYEGDYNGYATL